MKNSEEVYGNLERKVYLINFSKPSLHFLLGKLEFIIKQKKMQTRKEEKKMQEPSNFESKDSCKFYNANWLVKMSIMNSDHKPVSLYICSGHYARDAEGLRPFEH